MAATSKIPAPYAALGNALVAHAFDFDDTHERGDMHAYAVVFPAALAAAERAGGVSGEQLLTALTVGVDVAYRLGSASSGIAAGIRRRCAACSARRSPHRASWVSTASRRIMRWASPTAFRPVTSSASSMAALPNACSRLLPRAPAWKRRYLRSGASPARRTCWKASSASIRFTKRASTTRSRLATVWGPGLRAKHPR